MCFTRRTNKKVVKLSKLKSNKVYPVRPQSPTPKFNALLDNTKTKN